MEKLAGTSGTPKFHQHNSARIASCPVQAAVIRIAWHGEKMERHMTIKKLAGTAIMLAGISLAGLSATSAPAAARTVCDWRGYNCRYVPNYYGGTYGRTYDRDWRHDWRDRRGWERREAWRHRYYDRPYYDRRYGSGGGLWFDF